MKAIIYGNESYHERVLEVAILLGLPLGTLLFLHLSPSMNHSWKSSKSESSWVCCSAASLPL